MSGFIEKQQGETIWLKAPVFLDSMTPLDFGALYPSSVAGTPLNDLSLTAVSFTVKHLTALTVGAHVYAVGDVAVIYGTLTPVTGSCVLHQDLKNPSVKITGGLYGGADYVVEIVEEKTGSATANYLPRFQNIRVYLPPV